ncbi:hypothetical protein KIN20_027820 [Parelaphostrongylus tenuis]|uniref:Uncharacterized protein n=1 Tax=Parelaphostrongylus tenuis TaxID=148309 RepID=A0AAD5R069_PARTN|nr:hypothetical protein KIN20_027820 [Parelaphostrongylus tenuis]
MNKEQKCIIVDNTVTAICTGMRDRQKCMPGMMVSITSVANYTSISGTLKTTNIILANWPRTMWQNVLNRATRMLAMGPFSSHFFSASATVGGN